MPPTRLLNDANLTARDIAELENSERVIHFFSTLGYDVDHSQRLTHASLGMDTEDLEQRVRKITRIAADPDDEIQIILFEVRSVTVALTHAIAQRFRQRPGNYLLVLTGDYETLDFVLLERIKTEGKGTGGLPRYVIRPRILTVNRRNPGVVALRVLKRFTFTESDALYQWDKLRSAYSLAEWSEPDFNNRALFSDYYLKHRVTDKDLNPSWEEDVRRVGDEARRLLAGARERLTRENEQKTRATLIEPLLALMGFEFVANKPGSSGAEEPDYVLYAPGNREKPIALALTYKWNRNLDMADPERDRETPDENPGALIVTLLEKGDAPWVIMTNGKLWRLYSATASNKITNYYEIDLEEALFAPDIDRETAFKYWWLMFRREAFTGFLDKVLAESQEYAKKIREALKDRIFKHIFGYFAGGFIDHMRQQGLEDDQIDLDLVFNATMTFLYRLMFVLYAESLELVPVKEENGYGARSVRALKGEIAAIAGKIIDQADDRLREHYDADSTALYERLRRLFHSIDQGDADLNLPVYNGGLFSTETRSGAFLEQYAIPDVYLAIGLDQLARDVDDKTHELVFIDFKSLGVRQLGSIYEGLLEFKLRIAHEPLAVIRDGKREIYMPHAKAVKEKKNILDTLEPGRVYIENTKQERKATGSYYTPDYIVKYIVQHTVGPVLDEKFAALRPRLHEAQKLYRQHKATVEARRDSQPAELFWQRPEMQQLADDCLNVRVLDPAMGSGHFLVEAVDYISNRLIDFLNGWSENPVWALLERTRADILDEMERQGVSIDESKLTRVLLLKRSVLKRCVYGVDLNPMAVELAKVSLWLDAFTLGAPLSFLDHHLKCGNSLIGARIAEVQDYLAARAGETVDMFSGSKFAGVMLATDLMRQVSYLSDNTIEQTRRSAQAYRDARDHLAPYKRVLDVYTSRWFGNPMPKPGKTDNVRLFLQDPQVEAWLHDPSAPLSNALIPAEQIAETALRAAEEKRFFHWELEFPEVFFAPSTPGGQDVQLRKDGGFDAVVGNPPYGAELSDAEQGYIEDRFQTGKTNKNTGLTFIEVANSLAGPKKYAGLIVPKSLTYSDGWAKGVELILLGLTHLIDVSRGWQEVLLEQVIIIFSNEPTTETHYTTGVATGKGICETSQIDRKVYFELGTLLAAVSEYEVNVYLKLRDMPTFGECTEVFRGLPLQRSIKTEGTMPIYRGDHIFRYGSHEPDTWIDKSTEHENKVRLGRLKQPKIIAQNIVAHVTQPYPRIIIIANLDLSGAPNLDTVNNIVITDENYDIAFLLAVLNARFTAWYTYRFIYNQAIRTMHFDGPYVSKIHLPRLIFATAPERRIQLAEDARHLYARSLSEGPAAVLAFTAERLEQNETDVIHDLLAFLAQQMIDLNKQKQAEVRRFLGWLEARLDIRPDRHGKTGIESLSGRTIIQNYLGDYQKGEPETAFEDFYFRLHQNRGRLGVSLASIKAELEDAYRESLAVLLPIKQQLAHTDALIDRIVYQLYGLTDEEIRLIEYPALEQAVSTAREDVLKEKEIAPGSDEAIEKIAEKVEQAAVPYFARVDEAEIEARLRAEIAGWETLPAKVRTFLITGELLLEHDNLPDYSGVVISFGKAAETLLNERIFIPFRQSHTANDCANEHLQKFMRGSKTLSLGSIAIVLASSDEPALRAFVRRRYPQADHTILARDRLLALLTQDQIDRYRNGAAHDAELSLDDARAARAWALEIVGYV